MIGTQPTICTTHRARAIGPWQWAQRWSDLLFLHWRLTPDALRPYLPSGLDLDLWDGSPWISLVAFGLDVRHRVLPSFGLTTNMVELNLRTYVSHGSVPGIYFLSIHADKRVAVMLARWLTPLPYLFARIDYRRYGVRRFQCRPVQARANLDVTFAPCGQAVLADRNSRAEWLLERYALYGVSRRGKLLRTTVEHSPWIYHEAELNHVDCTLGNALGIDLHAVPDDAHFSSGVEAKVWPFVEA